MKVRTIEVPKQHLLVFLKENACTKQYFSDLSTKLKFGDLSIFFSFSEFSYLFTGSWKHFSHSYRILKV